MRRRLMSTIIRPLKGTALGEDDDAGKEWVPQGDGRDAVPLQLRRVREETVVFDLGEDDEDNDGEDLHKSKDRFNVNNDQHRPLRRSNSTERRPDYQ
ncbi:hypothetical protein Pst134EA_031988 [Puccinia striiformis f. sp. tritici]|uniref:uncharacterized protein n=1 Tax=Puccinia striiformis f. sp. tritici TaxID=168172 RepID=UPI0020076D98|nr:uncharacterized protein Pst134EA_031988 [Puccinia striiformis f. sp. tritici]KAH9441944.1 hypothetical protein Pst134EA_031988 [Puccinia striiformis f. sp. tritici]